MEAFGDGVARRMTMAQRGANLAVVVDGDVDEHAVLSRVRRMLQIDIPMGEFHAFCAGHPELEHIPGLRQGRLLRCPTLFEDVVKVITTTNTTWTQTIAMVDRIVEAFGTVGPDGGRAFPLPEQIAGAPLDDFAGKARLGYRNTAVHRIATDGAEGRLDLEALEDPALPAADLYKRFLALPGVGPYAASCLMVYVGRYERVNVDSWARMMVGKELGRSVTDADVHAFFEPYGPVAGARVPLLPVETRGAGVLGIPLRMATVSVSIRRPFDDASDS